MEERGPQSLALGVEGNRHAVLDSEQMFSRNVTSPMNFLFQECNAFTYTFAEEIRRQSFGAVTPGYDFMARLRYVCVSYRGRVSPEPVRTACPGHALTRGRLSSDLPLLK